MAVKVEILSTQDPQQIQYPLLRMWKADLEKPEETPLVVLFLNASEGFSLSDGNTYRLGKVTDEWLSPTDQEHWVPCSIMLSSEN